MATAAGSGLPAPARPSGTVTFLFSDIEGSTAHWERNSEEMGLALARHDALMRTALEARGAYIFKTIGDEFCAAFSTAIEAIAAALDAQRALANEDFSAVEGIRVRMALHVGSAAERDGDYFGPTINRVARLLAVGHGGQVLLSGVCAELAQGNLPPECDLRDLGTHRLKDLAKPERIFQLVAPNLCAEFPPLRSLDHLSNNLPAQLTSFVGRDEELAEIITLLQEHRLVTLVGAGGVGKTRTSLQVAANLVDEFADGAWFIELAPLTNGDYIPSTIARTLDVKLDASGDPGETLVEALKGKQALLVFDNCEHLIDPAARAIAAILRGCRNVKVLASSRQNLGIEGEVAYRVPSLPVPAATALFAERAQATDTRFALTGDNAPIVADICQRLDGIPLAIELAAARVKTLTPKQLREHLGERFRVLTGGDRSALPRHQTMRALIDWSHDLLDERERVLFRRLGIFVDGFTLEGAVAIGSRRDLDEPAVFEVLASLVDKSLVLAEPEGDTVRYRLLESTRAYASEKVDEAGERDLVTARHLRYLRDRFAELWQRRERTARLADLTAALHIDLGDVRSALDDAVLGSSIVDGGELLASVYASWQALGLSVEGTTRCEGYLAVLPSGELRLRARLSSALSFLLGNSGHKVRAFEEAARAVEYARASGDTLWVARALCQYAFTAAFLHQLDDADRALAQADEISEASADVRIQLLETRALVSFMRGHFEMAVRHYEELRKAQRSRGNTDAELQATLILAEIEHTRGQTSRAIANVREALAAVRALDDKGILAAVLANLAGYLIAVDDLTGAEAAIREAIGTQAAHEPAHTHVAIAIEHLALVLALRGDLERAAVLECYADTAFQLRGYAREFTELATYDRLTALLRERLTPSELAQRSTEGAALKPEDAVAFALEVREPA